MLKFKTRSFENSPWLKVAILSDIRQGVKGVAREMRPLLRRRIVSPLAGAADLPKVAKASQVSAVLLIQHPAPSAQS